MEFQNKIHVDALLTRDVSSSGCIMRLVADTKGTVPGFELEACELVADELGLAPTVIISSSIPNEAALMKEAGAKNN